MSTAVAASRVAHLPLTHIDRAVTAGATDGFVTLITGRLAQTSHASPSWSMAMQQATLQFFGASTGFTARPVGAGGFHGQEVGR